VAFGARPFGEKFCELGDAMVGALVPNPVQDDEGQGGGPRRRREEREEEDGRGGSLHRHYSSRSVGGVRPIPPKLAARWRT